MSFLPAVGAGAGLLGAGLSLFGAGTAAAGAQETGQAQSNAALYQAQVARNNAAIAQQNAAYTLQAGEVKAGNVSMQGAATSGGVKAAQAASGVDVNTGSAVTVQESQRGENILNADTTMSNANQIAYGYQVQAQSDLAQSQLETQAAQQDIIAGKTQANADILGGVGGALSGISGVASKWSSSGGGFGLG